MRLKRQRSATILAVALLAATLLAGCADLGEDATEPGSPYDDEEPAVGQEPERDTQGEAEEPLPPTVPPGEDLDPTRT